MRCGDGLDFNRGLWGICDKPELCFCRLFYAIGTWRYQHIGAILPREMAGLFKQHSRGFGRGPSQGWREETDDEAYEE